MSMAVGRGGSGGRRGRRGQRGRNKPMSEINVTPFVDVMLVLLVIFMVTAPLLTAGVPLDLPETSAKELNTDTKPVTISIQPDGKIFVQEDEVGLDGVVAALNAASPDGTDVRVLVRGDTNADYGAVMKVMSEISSAGYTKIGLLTAQAPLTQSQNVSLDAGQ